MLPNQHTKRLPANGTRFVMDIDRTTGVGDAPGPTIHHRQAPDAHGDVFVPEAPVQAIGDGLQAVFTGDDFLVGFKDGIKADIQYGPVLAGE